MPERIQIVDEKDQPIGASTRQEAWASGSYYRLVQIILRDKEGNFLLQKRSPKKALYPNRWTNAASGHVDEGDHHVTQREPDETKHRDERRVAEMGAHHLGDRAGIVPE